MSVCIEHIKNMKERIISKCKNLSKVINKKIDTNNEVNFHILKLGIDSKYRAK